MSPDSTIAPSRATPSEEPSCWPVNCSPPASPRPEASTEDWTTLPSWEASSPIPTPSTRHRPGEARRCRARAGSWPAAAAPRPWTITRPARTIDADREACRQPRPGRRGDEHRHRHGEHAESRLERVEAEHQLQVEGDVKKTPIRMRFCDRPQADFSARGDRNRARCTSGSGRCPPGGAATLRTPTARCRPRRS